MSNDKQRGGRGGWLYVIPALVLLYPLSLGPVYMAVNRGWITETVFWNLLSSLYLPVIWLVESNPWAMTLLDRYLEIWA